MPASGAATDAAMAIDYLAAIDPPLQADTMEKLRSALPASHVGLSTIAALGSEGLAEVAGISSAIERARIISAIGEP